MLRPNVLLIVADQLRPFELGCYGHATVRSPHVDELAADGLRFQTCVSNNPVCTPARAILVSGQYSRTCAGMMGNWGAPEPVRNRFPDPTLPEVFAAHGYRPFHLGKWHIHVHPQKLGFSNHPEPQNDNSDAPTYFPFAHDWHRGDRFACPAWENAQLERFFEQLPAADDAPWFCFHNIHLPHAPFDVMSADQLDAYTRDDVRLRPNVRTADGQLAHSRDWFLKHHHQGKKGSIRDDLSPDYDLIDYHRHYYAAVTTMDQQVGYALDLLERSGQAHNTYVIFLADHGDNLGSHQLFNKETMNEESCRIPMIVRGPGVPASHVNTEQVMSLVDLPATLLSLCSIPVPTHFQGEDRSPVIRGDADVVGRNVAFIEGMQDDIAIRTPTHKLSMKMTGSWNNVPPRTVLDDEHTCFDLRSDPFEQHNFARGDAQRATIRHLKQALRNWDSTTSWLAQYASRAIPT